MKYDSYETIVGFDEADRVLHGHTPGTHDIMSSEADFVDRIERAFPEAVDDSIEQCTETGREPDKSFSGRPIVRMEPASHRMNTPAPSSRTRGP